MWLFPSFFKGERRVRSRWSAPDGGVPREAARLQESPGRREHQLRQTSVRLQPAVSSPTSNEHTSSDVCMKLFTVLLLNLQLSIHSVEIETSLLLIYTSGRYWATSSLFQSCVRVHLMNIGPVFTLFQFCLCSLQPPEGKIWLLSC